MWALLFLSGRLRRLLHDRVERRGAQALAVVRGRLVRRLKHLLDALPRERARVHHARPLKHAQLRAQRLGVLVHRVRVLVDEVPLVPVSYTHLTLPTILLV